MVTIRMIIGSTRPERAGVRIADWVAGIARPLIEAAGDVKLETTDLKQLALPFFDEPVPPIFGKYSQPHTLAWADTVASSDGFIFIAPEYNHSYSAVLKNALDFVYREWHHKPCAFVAYGGHAGGTRATEHLRSIVGELRMYDLGEMVLIPHYWEHFGEDGAFAPPEQHTRAAEALVRAMIHWTRVLSHGRNELA